MQTKNIINDENKYTIIAVIVFIILFFLIYIKNQAQVKKETPLPEKIQADTFVPAGFVLVPIQLANEKAVSALVDQFAVVDLYTTEPAVLNSILIAEKVKLLRAPLDPSQFAVLLPENKAHELLKINGQFWVVLQNRNSLVAQTEVSQTVQNSSPVIQNTSTKSVKLTQINKKIIPFKIKIEYAK